MSLHWAAQYAILVFATANLALRGFSLDPADGGAGFERGEATAAAPAPPAAQEWTLEADRVLVTNLVGRVTLGYTTGDRILVRGQLRGADSEKLRFSVDEGADAEFHVLYPLADHRKYVYPELGRGHRTQIGEWKPRSRASGIKELLRFLTGRSIQVRGRPWSDAIEAWADLEILLPDGKHAEVKLGVGPIEAAGVRAPLSLDTRSGPVTVRDITGDIRIDTGSGRVAAQTVRGDLSVDTGSGSVEVEDVEGGDVVLDTGSGGVDAREVRAGRLEIDTGSGSVDASRVQARELVIDTGSGSVRASEIRAESAEIDTGSGSVTLDLAGMGPGRYLVDTGSGGVTLAMPRDASARIRASTGSGGIHVEIPAAQLFKVSRREVSLQLGDGRAEVVIDTGSGGVRIRERS